MDGVLMDRRVKQEEDGKIETHFSGLRLTDFVCANNDVPGTHGVVAPIGCHTQLDANKHARFVRLWDSGFPNTNVVLFDGGFTRLADRDNST